MSKASERKKAKKAAQAQKKRDQTAAGFEPRGGSHYSKKARRKTSNPNSPFFQGNAKDGE